MIIVCAAHAYYKWAISFVAYGKSYSVRSMSYAKRVKTLMCTAHPHLRVGLNFSCRPFHHQRDDNNDNDMGIDIDSVVHHRLNHMHITLCTRVRERR